MSCSRSSRRRRRGWSCYASEGKPDMRHFAHRPCTTGRTRIFSVYRCLFLCPRPSLFRMRRTGCRRLRSALARAAQRWAIQRLLQPRLPDFNKARVPAAAARIVGIFLCLPFPSRSPSSSGLDNIPGTSGEGVQEQTPSCGVFYELLAMVGRSLQNNSMHICRETGSFFRKSEGAERPPHAVS